MDSSCYYLVLLFVLAASFHGVHPTSKHKKPFKEPKAAKLDHVHGLKVKHGLFPTHHTKIPLWVDPKKNYLKKDPFIINGDETKPGDYPHQVILLVRGQSTDWFFFCGGSLISANHVLTAAHCIFSEYEYMIIAGLHDQRKGINGNPGAQGSYVNVTNVHPGWTDNPRGYPHDIAVLTLSTSITENEYVKYAKIPTASQKNDFDRTHCVVTGYGLTEYGSYSPVVRVAPIYTMTIKDCRKMWRIFRDTTIIHQHICGIDKSSSSCYGDSGSPLTCGGDTVVGIVSWGVEEEDEDSCSHCFPSIHTRVSSYYKWIRGAMGLE